MSRNYSFYKLKAEKLENTLEALKKEYNHVVSSLLTKLDKINTQNSRIKSKY